MLSATCHLLHFGIVPYALRLLPNTTSALEGKMICTDPGPRYSSERGEVFHFVAPGKARWERYGIQSGNS